MLPIRPLLFVICILLCFSCKEKRDTYAIRDFRNDFQPHLKAIVGRNIVGYGDSAVRLMATDEELVQLSKSEHPTLRAVALGEMLSRKSFNHFDVAINHLDDTARVSVDIGEFGVASRAVSDYVLHEVRWKTQKEKDITMDTVLAKHNYLWSAYLVLLYAEPRTKNYTFIKDMATRSRHLSEEGNEFGFEETEIALYALAKFRKKEDVPIIRHQLLKYCFELSHTSFRLMEEFPDTSYLDVFQKYHRGEFYRVSINSRGGFTGTDYHNADPEDFINALIVQQNERSARIFDTMLFRLPRVKDMPGRERITGEVMDAIWQHPCPAYAGLREKISAKMEAKDAEAKRNGLTPFETVPFKHQADTSKEEIRWFP